MLFFSLCFLSYLDKQYAKEDPVAHARWGNKLYEKYEAAAWILLMAL